MADLNNLESKEIFDQTTGSSKIFEHALNSIDLIKDYANTVYEHVQKQSAEAIISEIALGSTFLAYSAFNKNPISLKGRFLLNTGLATDDFKHIASAFKNGNLTAQEIKTMVGLPGKNQVFYTSERSPFLEDAYYSRGTWNYIFESPLNGYLLRVPKHRPVFNASLGLIDSPNVLNSIFGLYRMGSKLKPTNDIMPGFNIGQEVARLGPVRFIKEVPGEEVANIDSRVLANAPQKAYDDLAKTIVATMDRGHMLDPQSRNIKFDHKTNEFHIIDVSKAGNPIYFLLSKWYRSHDFRNMCEFLFDNYPGKFNDLKPIFEKAVIAGRKNGMTMKLPEKDWGHIYTESQMQELREIMGQRNNWLKFFR